MLELFFDRIIRIGNSSGVSTKRVVRKGAFSFIAKMEIFDKELTVLILIPVEIFYHVNSVFLKYWLSLLN